MFMSGVAGSSQCWQGRVLVPGGSGAPEEADDVLGQHGPSLGGCRSSGVEVGLGVEVRRGHRRKQHGHLVPGGQARFQGDPCVAIGGDGVAELGGHGARGGQSVDARLEHQGHPSCWRGRHGAKLGRPLGAVCDLFISVNDAMDELRGFRRVLVEEGHTTCAFALYKVLQDLVLDAGDILEPKVNVYFGDLFRAELAADLGLSVSQAMRVLGMFCLVQSIALAIGFLKMNAFAAKSGCLVEHKLKPEIDAALAYMDAELHELAELLAQPETIEMEGMDLPLTFTVSDASVWVKAAKLFASSAKRGCVVAMLEDSYALAEAVSHDTPVSTHVVTDKSYHPKLANKFLLCKRTNDKLSLETVALSHSMRAVQCLHSDWRLEPPFEQDPEFAEKRAYCLSAFSEAKKAMMLIAAVSIMEDSSGDKAKLASQANTLLAKHKSQLPASIVERLNLIGGLAWHGVATETPVVV